MDPKGSITKDVLSEEARFVLQNLLNEARHGKPNSMADIHKLLEKSVSIKLLDYIQFLEKYGYLIYNRKTNMVEVTREGELVVGGEKFSEFGGDVEYHFGARLGRTDATPRGEILDKRYEKQSVIGSGGIGTVYLGRQVNLDREVAIKEIRELFNYFVEQQRREIVRRFDESVQHHARLTHPNIISVLDVNAQREYPYVVMEYAAGGNLRRLLAYAEDFPVDLGIKYFLQICHALRSAHERGVIHRDLKPENVLLDSHGNAKVSDFGIARIVERDSAAIHQVYVGMGSVAYMAPEQIGDPRAASAQSDIYALGIMFYELLTRKLPGRRSPMPSQINPDIPKVIDDIFDRMTRDGHDERYASIDEVLDDFYRSDQTLKFIDRRVAVLFAENPVGRLVLHEPDYDEMGADTGGAQGSARSGASDAAMGATSAAGGSTAASGSSSHGPTGFAPASSGPASSIGAALNAHSASTATPATGAAVSTAPPATTVPATPSPVWSAEKSEPFSKPGSSELASFTAHQPTGEMSVKRQTGKVEVLASGSSLSSDVGADVVDVEADVADAEVEEIEGEEVTSGAGAGPVPAVAASSSEESTPDKEKPRRAPLARPLYSSLNQGARRKDKDK